ncbi:MAG TPA: ABC transporter ATP-binding protein [Croceibacterium sp.]|nr:ABC transporter ATP-binding protein [Croceibacterium sp.]
MRSLTVQNLSFAFGQLPVIDDVSFDARAGEIIALVGPSGCGKTTLLRCIAGLLRPDGGNVCIDGKSGRERLALCSFVFQRPTLLPWLTISENLELPPKLRNASISSQTIRAWLADFGLSAFEQSLPSQLSLGMAQRVAFVRALAEERPVILLDEPFSGLDELSKRELALLLSTTIAGNGLIGVVVTHSISDAVFLADRVVVLSPRPTHPVRTIGVSLPHPRTAGQWLGPELVPFMREVRTVLDEGVRTHAR